MYKNLCQLLWAQQRDKVIVQIDQYRLERIYLPEYLANLHCQRDGLLMLQSLNTLRRKQRKRKWDWNLHTNQ